MSLPHCKKIWVKLSRESCLLFGCVSRPRLYDIMGMMLLRKWWREREDYMKVKPERPIFSLCLSLSLGVSLLCMPLGNKSLTLVSMREKKKVTRLPHLLSSYVEWIMVIEAHLGQECNFSTPTSPHIYSSETMETWIKRTLLKRDLEQKMGPLQVSQVLRVKEG